MMSEIYVAACALDGKVIRMVVIADPLLERARAAFDEFGMVPPDAVVSFHAVPCEIGEALGLAKGAAAEWWLGAVIEAGRQRQ